MLKKSSIWLVVLISVVAIAFIATGCAKKQVVKEEAAAKPVVEVKKEEPAPEPPKVAEAPKEEPKPEPVKEEAAPEPKKEEAPPAKVEPLALVAMRIQFAFDDYNLSTKAKENLEKVASWMSKDPAVKIQIEGHTCEVGTNEYNLALGERRANSAKKYLEGMGVNSARLSTISYGEERPLDPGHTEDARSKNRRDEFVQTK
jgi:peptidoglycan-associated lipoprotein